jgi:DNA-binding response OmpR family regulator
MKILAADDNADSRSLLAEALPAWGHEVICVPDGRAAWSAWQDPAAPQLLLLDWVMPGLDGVQLCRRIRAQTNRSAPYIIMLTSQNRPHDIVCALEAGADDYLIKPYNLDELRARINVGVRILELQAQLREHERLQGALQMAGAVCHEMNQPLQIILTSTQLALLDLGPDHPAYESLQIIKSNVDRLASVTRRAMNATHVRTVSYLDPQTQIIDLNQPR